MSNKLYINVIVSSVLFVIVCRLPSLLVPIWNVDEGFTSVVANALREGGIPYRDSVDQRGPVSYFVYAAVFALGGKNKEQNGRSDHEAWHRQQR